MRFTFTQNHSKEFCIEKMARILGVSCSGYYKFLKRPISKRKLENTRLLEEIRKAYTKASHVWKPSNTWRAKEKRRDLFLEED